MKIKLVIALLFVYANAYTQYTLTPAFPNLGTFSTPTEIVNAKDGSNRLFISELTGKIYVFNNIPSVSVKKVFIDLASLLTGPDGALLGLAFHPNYTANRYFYVYYNYDSANIFWLRIARFTTSSTKPDSALLSSRLNLLTFSQPQNYHSGGKIQFGPDKYLYASFGDGGLEGVLAQNKTNLSGKLIRINIDSASGGRAYSYPVTNPYYGNTQGYKQEIYALGFRNMWKFSFDFPTSRLYGADVGEMSYEEINIVQNGKNYGWNKMEGFHCYGTCDTTGKGFTRPIYEYPHNGDSKSITGGYVYRGALRPELYGKYIYSDFIDGKVYALTYNGVNPPTNQLLLTSTTSMTTFGVDENNEMYMADYSSGIYKFYNINVMAFSLKATIEGFYQAQQNRLNVEDTVKVYLRNVTSPYGLTDSARMVIDSISLSGLGFFNNAPTGTYYIALKHRNGLETWCKSGGMLFTKGNFMSYDFTTASSQAYGNNMKLIGGKYCVYSGDVAQNGFVDAVDLVSICNKARNFTAGYFLSEDLNGDLFVDVVDVIIGYNNSRNYVGIARP